jgi:inhibitor of KinA sporulation pathway (predicted exonuclease)
MRALTKAIRGKRVLVFIDLEGTQFTHEAIEIGAVIALLNEDGTIKRTLKGFSTYLRPHGKVGSYVTRLTGITEQLLKDKGDLFPTGFGKFRDYVSKYRGKCTYVAFGNQDMKMINESVYENGEYGRDFAREIAKNYLDFSTFINVYVKDDAGNMMSLSRYLEFFGVPFEGQAHDALADARNLALLYDAFLKKPDLVRDRYMRNLSNLNHLPSPIQGVLKRLNEGKSVTPEDYMSLVEESLR